MRTVSQTRSYPFATRRAVSRAAGKASTPEFFLMSNFRIWLEQLPDGVGLWPYEGRRRSELDKARNGRPGNAEVRISPAVSGKPYSFAGLGKPFGAFWFISRFSSP